MLARTDRRRLCGISAGSAHLLKYTDAVRTALNIGHGSDVGRVRSLNEDFHRVWEYPFRDGRLLLFGVADGMGGAAAGEYASRKAIQVLDECFQRYVADVAEGKPVIGLERLVERCVRLANVRLHRKAAEVPSRAGMGSTLTFFALQGPRAYLAHVGDSRAWLVRGESITQLTRDHTWVEEQMSLGLLEPEAARDHEWRNLLTRVLGTHPEVEVDVQVVEVLSGDVLLVSTDGLHGLVEADEILAEIRTARSAQSSVEFLISRARERGGPDNITLVIVEVP